MLSKRVVKLLNFSLFYGVSAKRTKSTKKVNGFSFEFIELQGWCRLSILVWLNSKFLYLIKNFLKKTDTKNFLTDLLLIPSFKDRADLYLRALSDTSSVGRGV